MPNTPTRFRREVIDIADQLRELGMHREGLLGADTMRALDSALEGVEGSVDMLKSCVSGLRYRVGLKLSAPQNGGQ
jgi:hypothetical protein